MAYSLKTKKEVINHVHQGMPIPVVSQMYNLSRHAISNWLKYPEKYLNEARTGHMPFDIEEKVQVLHLIGKGDLTIRQIADLKQIKVDTIRNWVRDKNRILAVYSSQGHHLLHDENSPGEEREAVSTSDNKDLKQHIRDLKDENEYLKAKVAYLEAPMEINGTPVAELKKKFNIRPSIQSSEKGLET